MGSDDGRICPVPEDDLLASVGFQDLLHFGGGTVVLPPVDGVSGSVGGTE